MSATLCVALGLGAAAQRFNDGYGFNTNFPGVSDGCKDAMNSTVACDSFLADARENYIQFSSEELDKICAQGCVDSLKEYRSKVEETCSAETDVIVIDEIAYPATYTADELLYHYNITCDREE